MKRFYSTVAIATVLGLCSASTADAQIVYGYTVPRGNGIVTNNVVYGPGVYQQSSNFYSPYSGIMQGQAYGTNIFGQGYNRSYGYNSFTGLGYRTGFYQPSYYVSPFSGYNYRYFGRRW